MSGGVRGPGGAGLTRRALLRGVFICMPHTYISSEPSIAPPLLAVRRVPIRSERSPMAGGRVLQSAVAIRLHQLASRRRTRSSRRSRELGGGRDQRAPRTAEPSGPKRRALEHRRPCGRNPGARVCRPGTPLPVHQRPSLRTSSRHRPGTSRAPVSARPPPNQAVVVRAPDWAEVSRRRP